MQGHLSGRPTDDARLALANQWCVWIAVIGGVVTDIAALFQFGSGGIGVVFGVWNLVASAAYYYAAYRLNAEHEKAISFALKLSGGSFLGEAMWAFWIAKLNGWLDPGGQPPTSFIVTAGLFLGSDAILLIALSIYSGMDIRRPKPVEAGQLAELHHALSPEREHASTPSRQAIQLSGDSSTSHALAADAAAALFLRLRESFVTWLCRYDFMAVLGHSYKANVTQNGVRLDAAYRQSGTMRFAVVFSPRVTYGELDRLVSSGLRCGHVLVVGIDVEREALRRRRGDRKSVRTLDVVDLTNRTSTAPDAGWLRMMVANRPTLPGFERHLRTVYGVTLERRLG